MRARRFRDRVSFGSVASHFHCDREFDSLKDFRKSFERKDGDRADHKGELPAEADVRRLALQANDESCNQVSGSAVKKAE